MRITTIGRGAIGGTLARLWTSAGHEVTELGRDGGDATGAGVVLLAVPSGAVEEALAGVRGLTDQVVVIDATNRLGGQAAPAGHASVAEYVKAQDGRPGRQGVQPQLRQAVRPGRRRPHRPDNIWVGDEAARPP